MFSIECCAALSENAKIACHLHLGKLLWSVVFHNLWVRNLEELHNSNTAPCFNKYRRKLHNMSQWLVNTQEIQLQTQLLYMWYLLIEQSRWTVLHGCLLETWGAWFSSAMTVGVNSAAEFTLTLFSASKTTPRLEIRRPYGRRHIVYKLVDCIVFVYIAVIINYCCKQSVILTNNNNK